MPFHVAKLLLGQHNKRMHDVEWSAGYEELLQFMKLKSKEDAEIYEECRVFNYAIKKLCEEQDQYLESHGSQQRAVVHHGDGVGNFIAGAPFLAPQL